MSVVRRGHFVYESGDHGDAWLALELLLADPRRLQQECAKLAGHLRQYDPDLVCGPLLGGAFVAQLVALELGIGFLVVERQPAHNRKGVGYAFAEGLRPLIAGKRVVIVDDAINVGSATLACGRGVESHGGIVAAAASLIMRDSAGPAIAEKLGAPVEALSTIVWNIWPAQDCPSCRAAVAVE